MAKKKAGRFWDKTRRFQAELLQEYLTAAEGNVTLAASCLEIQRTYFYRLCRALGVTVRP